VAIETLFIDAGGVLVHPSWPIAAEALRSRGLTVDVAALATASLRAMRALDTGETISKYDDSSRAELHFRLALEAAGLVVAEDVVAGAWEEVQVVHRARNWWEHVPAEVPAVLDRFREQGLRLVVVSNSNGTLRSHLARLGLAQRFDLLIDSFEVGVEKPDPRIFEIALERSGARRETTVHVGDLYHVDVAGARAAGLRAVLVDAAGLRAEADCPRIASLAELEIEDL
jgi:HAD superfamily hydrolase (TIGR01509 family)